MSVIKFRLRKDNQVIGFELLTEDGWEHQSFEGAQWNKGTFNNNAEREQFTNKKDKNGVEIYNGSEIYFSQSKTQHFKGYVKWSDKELCYLVHCYWEKQDEVPHFCDGQDEVPHFFDGYEMKYTYETSCVKRLDSECFDIVVIGNIHEGEINNDAS